MICHTKIAHYLTIEPYYKKMSCDPDIMRKGVTYLTEMGKQSIGINGGIEVLGGNVR